MDSNKEQGGAVGMRQYLASLSCVKATHLQGISTKSMQMSKQLYTNYLFSMFGQLHRINAMGIWQRIRHLLVVKVHTFSEPEGAASCTDGQAAHWAAPARRLILLSLPTYSPWLNPIEMVWMVDVNYLDRSATTIVAGGSGE
ncbi:transposase [Polaromonas glacialis]|uniref:transposase n=1 Tax=Polaromonas glacialis TaxID=866564 RepID=UPI00049574E7|nr:transposase [Polaromonas glacialis]